MTDHVLDRIHFDPKAAIDPAVAHHPNKLNPIPWPATLAPTQLIMSDFAEPGTPLFTVKSVIVTWTSAEWQALTDVLAPSGDAVHEHAYTYMFDSYAGDLTDRSPARDAKCLARVRLAQASNGKTVLLVHSMLHLATDGPNLPLRRFINQMIDETECERLITTGTAGALLASQQLGDVVVGASCRFNCQKQFRDAAFAQMRYPTTLGYAGDSGIDLGPLFAANAGQVPRAAMPESFSSAIQLRTDLDVETVDYFAFGTSDDHFSLDAQDQASGVVEMDDACFGLAIADRLATGKPCPHWGAVRNCSDPVADMSKYATFEDAATAMGLIYRKNGYWTTVPSAIVGWIMAAK